MTDGNLIQQALQAREFARGKLQQKSNKNTNTSTASNDMKEIAVVPGGVMNVILDYSNEESIQKAASTTNTSSMSGASPCSSSSSSSNSCSSSSLSSSSDSNTSSSSPGLEPRSHVAEVNSKMLLGRRGAVPLVSTLFHSIKSMRLRELLAAIVSGKPDNDLNKESASDKADVSAASSSSTSSCSSRASSDLSSRAKAVKEILDKDPSLVLEKLGENEFVTALSGHQFGSITAYQAALSVDDTQMAELVKSYFKDKKEADKQCDEQYPEGWVDAEKKKWKPIFEQLNKLTLAIRDSKAGDVTSSGNPDYIASVKKGSLVEQEFIAFWRLLDATLDEVVRAGKRPFNSDLLLEALKTYDNDDLYQKYFGGRWDDPRAVLFVQGVIGYNGIQRFMPVNYVQAHRDGLDNTVKKLQKNQPQGRSTQFEVCRSGNWVPVDFYPLHPRGASGFNFMIDGPRLGCSRAGVRRQPPCAGRAAVDFEGYVNQKQQACRTYATTPRLSS